MRLVLHCMILKIPVEVEVEGEDLNPSQAAEILGSCLGSVDAWLERITVEKTDQGGGQPGMLTSPEVTSTALLPRPEEATP